MKSLKTLVTAVAIAAGSLAFGPEVLAQKAPESPGLIGKSFGGADFAFSNYSSSVIDTAYGVGILANLPVTPTLDFGASYDFARTSDSPVYVRSNTLRASLLNHATMEYGKPYFVGSLGYAWDRTTVSGVGSLDSGVIWGLGFGMEKEITPRLSLDGRLSYTDSFNGTRGDVFQLSAALMGWFTPRAGVRASASYDQISKAPDAVTFRLGIRWLL